MVLELDDMELVHMELVHTELDDKGLDELLLMYNQHKQAHSYFQCHFSHKCK